MSDELKGLEAFAGTLQAEVDEVRGEPSRTFEFTQSRSAAQPSPDTEVSGEQAFPLLPTGSGQVVESSRFEKLDQIGIGGMGVVYKVHDRIMRRHVAMKIMHPHLASDAGHRRRFLQEAHVTGQLDHPNIVPVYDLGMLGAEQAFFVMKLVDGETLSQLLRRHCDEQLVGPPLEEYLQIFLKVCDAIAFAHSRGIIHRDLKPGNIMVGTHGEVYVMDWGIAMVQESALSPDDHQMSPHGTRQTASLPEGVGSVMGTAAYMSPEQAHSQTESIDVRTDVFGLGGILYEILTGRPPYPGDTPHIQLQMAKTGDICAPQQAAPHRRLPPGLCHIAMRALSPDRHDRQPTVQTLKEEVRAFLRGGGWFHTLRFEPGTVIVQEGDCPESAYIINDGYCEVYKQGRNGSRQLLRRLGPGDVFGETGILTNKPRTASVRAVSYVTATVITSEALGYEIAEKGWLSALVRALAERFRDLDQELSRLREPD